jgi:hypothetical protein
MENVVFDMAHFDLPYNAILERLVFTKFMAAVQYAYSTLKISGPSRINTVKADIKWSVHCAEKLYEAMAAASPDDGERPELSSHPPAKQWISPDDTALTKVVHLVDDREKMVTIGAQLGEK